MILAHKDKAFPRIGRTNTLKKSRRRRIASCPAHTSPLFRTAAAPIPHTGRARSGQGTFPFLPAPTVILSGAQRSRRISRQTERTQRKRRKDIREMFRLRYAPLNMTGRGARKEKNRFPTALLSTFERNLSFFDKKLPFFLIVSKTSLFFAAWMPHGRRTDREKETNISKGFGYEKNILKHHDAGSLPLRDAEFTDWPGHPRLREGPDETLKRMYNESKH